MSFITFQDYINERVKHPHGVVSDDKGFANRDYEGDLSLKPKPQQRLKPADYYGKDCQKNPGLMTADGSDRGKPLGDIAGSKPSKDKKKKKKMKVEQFLDKTRKMSDVEFTKHLLENVKKVPTPVSRDLHGKEYIPEPSQTLNYVAKLMITNENIMQRMVRELKRNKGLHLLVAEVLSHPETYEYMNEAARGEFGKIVEQKMTMFFEGISPPRASGSSQGGGTFGGGGIGNNQGGSFGGGGPGAGGGQLASGITNGASAGGFGVNNGGNVKGMGEDEMQGVNGGGMDDAGGNINLDDDEHHDDEHHDDEDLDHDDEDLDHDDDDEGLDHDDDEDDDDEDGDDDDDDDDDDFDDNEHEDDDLTDKNQMPGMGNMGGM